MGGLWICKEPSSVCLTTTLIGEDNDATRLGAGDGDEDEGVGVLLRNGEASRASLTTTLEADDVETGRLRAAKGEFGREFVAWVVAPSNDGCSPITGNGFLSILGEDSLSEVGEDGSGSSVNDLVWRSPLVLGILLGREFRSREIAWNT